MKFSVIVPFLNEELYLESCIQALRHQYYDRAKYELIFVDNGSTDRSNEIVRQYSDITLLSEPRPDPYLARNRGIERASGEILAFTDADCKVSPGWLAALDLAFHQNHAVLVLGKLLFPTRSSFLMKYFEDYFNLRIAYNLQHLPQECQFGNAGNMAVGASVFKTFGLFSGMPIPGDTEVVQWCTGSNSPGQVVYNSDARVTHCEVVSLLDCLKKLHSYGSLARNYEVRSEYRPFTLTEKLGAFSYCASESGYGFFQKLMLLGLLSVGLIAFELGRRSAHHRPTGPASVEI